MNISGPFVHRRSSYWPRLPQNRPQTPVTSTGHRRKSRSPDAGGRVPPDEQAVPAESSNARKRKKQNGALNAHLAATSQSTSARALRASHDVDMVSDRGRKPRRRPQSIVSEDIEMRMPPDVIQSSRRRGKSGRKGRSRSHDVTRLSQKAISPEASDEGESEQRRCAGTLAIPDYARMREELDRIKQHMEVSNKTIKQQSKVIDGLRRDLAMAEKSHGEQRKQTEKLRIQLSKSEEVMSSIEANLNCQICMDVLLKPYGLSPCGHVLCLTCLQGWFRAAPPGEDEMYDDEIPDALIYRKKSCPVCRTIVLSRPIPLFLVKSMAHALDKAKQLCSASPRVSPPPDPEVDPWAGIFESDDMSDEEDDDGVEDGWSGDEDEDGGVDLDGDHEYDDSEEVWGYEGYEGYGTDEDEEPYEGEYVPARWVPPTVYVSPDDYAFEDLTQEQLSMLRRGATLQMIELFSMSYTRDDGLKAIIDGNELYLGYNIVLQDSDQTGEDFMDWAVTDVFDRPERWEKEDTEIGFVAWRFIREDEVDEEEYYTTDSEAWAADLVDDDEF